MSTSLTKSEKYICWVFASIQGQMSEENGQTKNSLEQESHQKITCVQRSSKKHERLTYLDGVLTKIVCDVDYKYVEFKCCYYDCPIFCV